MTASHSYLQQSHCLDLMLNKIYFIAENGPLEDLIDLFWYCKLQNWINSNKENQICLQKCCTKEWHVSASTCQVLFFFSFSLFFKK